jgi:DNA polymerase-3 subunit beta
MKVVCDRGALLDGVNLVAAVVPSRTPTPQLSCIKLVATKNGGVGELTLTGADGETSLVVSLANVDVLEPGQALVPADKLRGIVSAEEGEPTLALETSSGGSGGAGGAGDTLHIRGQNAHFRVLGYPASEYPPVPDFAKIVAGTEPEAPRTTFSQTSGALLSLVARTAFATARETSRYAINGVLLKRDGKKLEMVATDGRRLAVARATLSGAEKGSAAVSCIIPGKALNILQKLAADDEEQVRVAVTENRIFFAFEPAAQGKKPVAPRAVLSSTLVEGAFPPYEDVIPKDQNRTVRAGRDELSLAVRKASVLTNEESRGVRMTFKSDTKKLTLSSRAPEMGEAEIDVALNGYEGDDLEISFNPAFIADVLRVCDEAEVIVELKGPDKPGLIRSAASDFLYVVMPVTLPR